MAATPSSMAPFSPRPWPPDDRSTVFGGPVGHVAGVAGHEDVERMAGADDSGRHPLGEPSSASVQRPRLQDDPLPRQSASLGSTLRLAPHADCTTRGQPFRNSPIAGCRRGAAFGDSVRSLHGWSHMLSNRARPIDAGITVGVTGQQWRASVSAWGAVTPWAEERLAPLDWAVAADDRWHLPSKEPAVRTAPLRRHASDRDARPYPGRRRSAPRVVRCRSGWAHSHRDRERLAPAVRGRVLRAERAHRAITKRCADSGHRPPG